MAFNTRTFLYSGASNPRWKNRVIQYDWDDSWGAEPTPEQLKQIEQRWESTKGAELQSDEAAKETVEFSKDRFGFSDETGIPWKQGTLEQTFKKQWDDSMREFPITPEQINIARRARREEMTPPPIGGPLVGMFMEAPAATLDEAVERMTKKDLLKGRVIETARKVAAPVAAVGKGLGYTGMKIGQEVGELATGVPFKPEHRATFEASQDPLTMASEGWKELAGAPAGYTIATPYGQAALMGMSPEEQDEWFRRHPLLASVELGGDLALQLGAGFGAGGIGLSGGSGKFATTTKALGWMLDPLNKLQFVAQERAASQLARASTLGLTELPETMMKRQAGEAEILKKVQELQQAVASGNTAAAGERWLGRLFLPGMAAGAVESLDVALDENRSERERALALTGFVQSAGFSGLALYHATRQARNPQAGEFVKDPIARAALEKIISAESPEKAKEQVAFLRQQWEEYDAYSEAKKQQEAIKADVLTRPDPTLLDEISRMRQERQYEVDQLQPLRGWIDRNASQGEAPRLASDNPEVTPDELAHVRALTEGKPVMEMGIPPEQLPPTSDLTPREQLAPWRVRKGEVGPPPPEVPPLSEFEARARKAAEAPPPPMEETLTPPPTMASEEARAARREELKRKVREATTPKEEEVQPEDTLAPRLPFRRGSFTEAERAHSDRVLGSDVGKKAVAVLSDVGQKLSGMMNRFTLSEKGRVEEHGKWAGFAPSPENMPGVLGWASMGDNARAQSDVTTIATNVLGQIRSAMKVGGRESIDPKLVSHMFAERVVDHMIHEATHPLSRAGHEETFWNPEDIRLTPEGDIDAPTHAEAFEEMFKAHKEALQKTGEYDALVKQIREDITAKDVQKLSDLRYEFETDKVKREMGKTGEDVGGAAEEERLEPPPGRFPASTWKDRVLEEYRRAARAKDFEAARKIAHGLPPQGPDSLQGIIEESWRRGEKKSGKDRLPAMDELKRMRQPKDEWKLSKERKAAAIKVLQQTGKAERELALKDPEVQKELTAEAADRREQKLVSKPKVVEEKITPPSEEKITPPPIEGDSERQKALLGGLDDAIKEIHKAKVGEKAQLRDDLYSQITSLLENESITKNEATWMRMHVKEATTPKEPLPNEPLAAVEGVTMSHGIEAPESIASIEELSLERQRSRERAGVDLPPRERLRKMAEPDTAEDEARFAAAEKLTQEFEREERDTIQEIPVSVYGVEAPNEVATELIHGVMADPAVAKVQRVVQRLEPSLSRSVFGVAPKKTGRLGVVDAFGWAKLDQRTIHSNPLYQADHILNVRGLRGDAAVDAFKSVMADIIVHESTHAKTQLRHKAIDALTFGGEFGKRNKQEQLKARQLKRQLDSLLGGTKDNITLEDVKALADLWNKELAPGGDFDAEPVSLKKLSKGKLENVKATEPITNTRLGVEQHSLPKGKPYEMRSRVEEAKKGLITWKSETGAVDVGAVSALSGAMIGGLAGMHYGGPVGALVGAGVGAVGSKALVDALAGVKPPAVRSGKEILEREKGKESRGKEVLRDMQTIWLSAVVGGKDTVYRNLVQTVVQGGLLGAVDFAHGVSYIIGNKSAPAQDAMYRTLHRVASIKNADYARLIGDTVKMSMKGAYKGEGHTGLQKYKSLERLGRKYVDKDLQRQFELVMSGEVEIGGGKTRPLRPMERIARVMMLANAAQERAFRFTIMERELAPFMKREGLTSDRLGYAKLYQRAKKDPSLQNRLIAAMSKAENIALWRTKGLHSAPGSLAFHITQAFEKVPLFSRLIMQFPNYYLNNFLTNMIETNAPLQFAFDTLEKGTGLVRGPSRSSRSAHENYHSFVELSAKYATGYEGARNALQAFREQYGQDVARIEAMPAAKRSAGERKLLQDYRDKASQASHAKTQWKEEQQVLREHFKKGYYGKEFHTKLKLMGGMMMALGYMARMAQGENNTSPFELEGEKDEKGGRKLKGLFPLLAELSPMWLMGDWVARRKMGSDYYKNKSLGSHFAQVFSGSGRPIANEGIVDVLSYFTKQKDEEGEKALRKIAANLGQQVGKLGTIGDVIKTIQGAPKHKVRPDIPVGGEEEPFAGVPQSFARGIRSGYYDDASLVPSYDATSGEVRKPLTTREMLLNFGMSQRDQSVVERFLEENPKAKKSFLRGVTGKTEWDKRTYGKMREALETPYIRTNKGEKITIPQMLQSDEFTNAEKESLLNTHLTKAIQGEETEMLREVSKGKVPMTEVPRKTREELGGFEEKRKMGRDLRGEKRHFPREARPLRRFEKIQLDKLTPIPRQGGGGAEGGGGGGGAPSSKLISDASRRHGVDEKLLKAVISVESAGKKFAVSSKGARGWMQVMPATFKAFGGKDPTNGWENVMVGTKYLKHLLDMFDGDVKLALAAYNAGPSRVRSGRPLPAETKDYVRKVMVRYER